MPILSARFLALPVAALAVIVALSQAHSQSASRGTEITPVVERVTSCAAPTNTLLSACAVATAEGASLMR